MDIKAIHAYNKTLRHLEPHAIITWALARHTKPIVSTNFRPFEAVILHACTRTQPDIPVIWCDTGYNTQYTYEHALRVIETLQLHMHIYVPRHSVAYRNAVFGGIPDIQDKTQHQRFTEQVKIEPFTRAMKEHAPDLWFTNIRKGQTALRDSLDIISVWKHGILRVSPFFYHTDDEMSAYLQKHNLPNETRYFDPTKVLETRECGIHSGGAP